MPNKSHVDVILKTTVKSTVKPIAPVCQNCKWWGRTHGDRQEYQECTLVQSNPANTAFIVSGHSGALFTSAAFGCNQFEK